MLKSISERDFAACEHCNSSAFTCMYGADVRLSECAWAFGANGAGIAPTIPYPHAQRRAFGLPVEELLDAAKAVAERNGRCEDERCRFALTRAVSTRISATNKTDEAYAAEVRALWDVYSRAKATLRQSGGDTAATTPPSDVAAAAVATVPGVASGTLPAPPAAAAAAAYQGIECAPHALAEGACPLSGAACGAPPGSRCVMWRTGAFLQQPQEGASPGATPCASYEPGTVAAGRWVPASPGCAPLPWLDPASLRGALSGHALAVYGGGAARRLFLRTVWAARGLSAFVERRFRADAIYAFNETHDFLAVAGITPDGVAATGGLSLSAQAAEALTGRVSTLRLVWELQVDGERVLDPHSRVHVIADGAASVARAALDAAVFVKLPPPSGSLDAVLAARSARTTAPPPLPLAAVAAGSQWPHRGGTDGHPPIFACGFSGDAAQPVGAAVVDAPPGDADCSDGLDLNGVMLLTHALHTQPALVAQRRAA